MSNSGMSLVVGSSGQVGNAIISLLDSSRVVRAGRTGTAGVGMRLDLASLPARLDHVLEAEAIDAVYCVGGMTDVDLCEREPELAIRTNCNGPAALAAAAARRGIRFVYFSTEYVFSGRNGPYAEEDMGDPISAYGESKWRGELAVREAHPNPLIIRTTVVYGHDPRAKNFLYTLHRVVGEGRPFRVPNDQVSTPTYNRDLASAAVCLAEAGLSGIYHVCGPERLSRFDFARRAAEIMGLDGRRIIGVPTSELNQVAPRPLSAGLSTHKLARLHPRLTMRGVEESIRDWFTAGGHPW